MSRDDLPAPRLQLRWAARDQDSQYQWECHYELVLPLGEYDIRREQYDDDGDELPSISELVVPIKPPTRRGSSSASMPCVHKGAHFYDTPFRDGAHAQWDAKALGNIPIFVIAPDGVAIKHSSPEVAAKDQSK
jgi:hypothetical protein